MAGVKGRSGGARPGAGRPRNPPEKVVSVDLDGTDMLALLQEIALGHVTVSSLQLRAAISAVQYTHAKAGDAGKRARAQAEAEHSIDLFPTFREPTAPGKLLQ